MLRFYYSVDNNSVAADAMSRAFSEAFAELAGVKTDESPFYNIVPVSGSGCSACTYDVITCELLASKT
jgi:diphthine-ammonia ligase